MSDPNFREISRLPQGLLDALKLIAIGAEDQIAVLPEYVDVPDEIICSFGDQFDLAVARDEFAECSDGVRSGLEELSKALDALCRHPELLSVDAVRGDPEWEQLRGRAKEVLQLLGEKVERPQLVGVTYVRS